MPATMTEIAREANVSVSLVSRLLNEDSTLQIREDKRRRILDVRDRLGGVRLRRRNGRRRQLARQIIVPINIEKVGAKMLKAIGIQ